MRVHNADSWAAWHHLRDFFDLFRFAYHDLVLAAAKIDRAGDADSLAAKMFGRVGDAGRRVGGDRLFVEHDGEVFGIAEVFHRVQKTHPTLVDHAAVTDFKLDDRAAAE